MILWDFVPPCEKDTTYTKHVYQYSKHYVLFQGGTMLQRQKTENVAIWS